MRDLVVILIVVLLVFGTKKLRSIGSDLGAAVKGFKKGMAGEPERAQGQISSSAAPSGPPDAEFPEASETRRPQREGQGR